MKTAEFKLNLNNAQKAELNDWMSALKWVWNEGVRMIDYFNQFNAYHKPDKRSYPCSPILGVNHKRRYKKGFNGCTKSGDRPMGIYPSCPIGWIADSFNPEEPAYAVSQKADSIQVKNLSFFSLQKLFTHSRNQDRPWLISVPSKFIDGETQSLVNSWEAFKSGVANRKPPKYKGKRDKIESLIHNNSKGMGVKGDSINIPKIGYVRVKGFSDRWLFEDGKPIDFCPMKICKKASGWYLQITGHLPDRKYKKTSSIAGFDVGVHEIVTDDIALSVKSPRWLKTNGAKLKKLQRKVSRQWRMNENNDAWERKNWQKTQNKIARLHEKIARQRRAFNHYLSHKIVNTHQVIALEDLKLLNMTKAVKTGEAGVANGRKAKSGLNRAMLDVGIGQLVSMIETKAKVAGRDVVFVDPKHTSQICPECGHVEKKKNRKNRNVKCSNCGAEFHRDRSAAIEIKKRAVTKMSIPKEVKKERKPRGVGAFAAKKKAKDSRPIFDPSLIDLPLFG